MLVSVKYEVDGIVKGTSNKKVDEIVSEVLQEDNWEGIE
jgi:hypothetical protein